MRRLENPANLTVVILAGGLGTRLRSVVSDRPKTLAEIHGRPFLAYLLDQVAAAGMRHVVLCTGYKGEMVRESFGKQYKGLQIFYSMEPHPLGTGGALRLALPLFLSETILVMNGDSYCHADLEAFWEWHRAKKRPASMMLAETCDTGRYGQVSLNRENRVLRFTEKGGASGRGWVNAGLYLLEKEMIAAFPRGKSISLECDMLPGWIESGVYGFKNRGEFLDIGTPESYGAAERFFAQEDDPSHHRYAAGF